MSTPPVTKTLLPIAILAGSIPPPDARERKKPGPSRRDVAHRQRRRRKNRAVRKARRRNRK